MISIVIPLFLFFSTNAKEKRGKLHTTNDEMKSLWEKFKQDCNKSYKNSVADSRFDIFKQNLKSIDKKNSVNQVHGVNCFADLTDAEFRSIYLGKKVKSSNSNEDSSTKLLEIFVESKIKHEPVRLQSLVEWPSLITPIKNQGYCGSCWAFSAIEQIETDAIRTLGYSFTNITYTGSSGNTLSAAQVVQCDTSDYGCNGGFQDRALLYVKNAGGITTDTVYPYTSGATGSTGTCQSVSNSQKVLTVTNYVSVSGESNIASYVQNFGPISISVVAKNWNSYTGGILSTCGCASTGCTLNDLDHAVQAVGVDTAGGYWKARNQWGSYWGESGYIRFTYGNNICGIATDSAFYTTVARVSSSNSPTTKPTVSTFRPSSIPSIATTRVPTKTPTSLPSRTRSPSATFSPSNPTLQPSSVRPTIRPTSVPSYFPTATAKPTTTTPTISSTLYPTSTTAICPSYSATSK